MVVITKRWWRVTEIPFCDYGTSRLPDPIDLGYFHGTKREAEEAGEANPRHDSWGYLRVEPLHLEDLNTEITQTEGQITGLTLKLEEQRLVRDAILNEMGL